MIESPPRKREHRRIGARTVERTREVETDERLSASVSGEACACAQARLAKKLSFAAEAGSLLTGLMHFFQTFSGCCRPQVDAEAELLTDGNINK